MTLKGNEICYDTKVLMDAVDNFQMILISKDFLILLKCVIKDGDLTIFGKNIGSIKIGGVGKK